MAYVTLIMNPFLMASGNVTMRKMRKMHELVVSSYLNASLCVGSALLVYFLGESFQFIGDFDTATWIMMVTTSILTVLG